MSKNVQNIKLFVYTRRPHTSSTPPLHVTYPQQGDQTGNDRSQMALGARIPLPAQCQKRARQAGHSNAQIQNGYFRQRLFLMKRLSRTEEMYNAHFEE